MEKEGAKPEEELQKAYRELALAKTKYEKGLVREKIRQIEKTLTENPIERVERAETQFAVVSIANTLEAEPGKILLEKRSDENFESPIFGKSVVIKNSKSLKASSITSETSFYIENTHNSEIHVVAQQIRVYLCTGLVLHVYSKTGVYIEKSEAITVVPFEPENNAPEWSNDPTVHDFSQTTVI